MLNSVDFSGKPFHFIGVGGIGMSALAYILTKRKLPVSGSDIRLNHITQRLQELGAHIFLSQDASNLEYFQKKCSLGNGSYSGEINRISWDRWRPRGHLYSRSPHASTGGLLNGHQYRKC